MNTLHKAFGICFGLFLSLGATPSASAQCSFEVPLPPDPIPPDFDWTTLAQNWCSQLEECGYPTSTTCISDYMEQINSPIVDPSDPPPDESTIESSTEVLSVSCQDSEEYRMGTYDCGEPVPRQKK